MDEMYVMSVCAFRHFGSFLAEPALSFSWTSSFFYPFCCPCGQRARDGRQFSNEWMSVCVCVCDRVCEFAIPLSCFCPLLDFAGAGHEAEERMTRAKPPVPVRADVSERVCNGCMAM